MRTERIQLKLYADAGGVGDPERFVPIFHDWIRSGLLGEVLVDVARYGHVRHGPAVILVGHLSDYAIDLSEGRPGLLTTRKRGAADDADRISNVARHALRAADLLERQAPGLRFATGELLLRAPDRLHVPNSPETFEAERAGLQRDLAPLFGDVELAHEGGPVEPFTVRIRRTLSEPVATVLART